MRHMPVPKSTDELRDLEFKRKGEWSGAGWLLAVAVWFLTYFDLIMAALVLIFMLTGGVAWAIIPMGLFILFAGKAGRLAQRFMNDFHTVWFGVVWAAADTESLELAKTFIGPHEAVHDYHQRVVNLYRLKYIFPHPVWRRATEAQAYALDVLLEKRTLDRAARSMADPIYLMFLTEEEALVMIKREIERWIEHCEDFEGWL